LTPRAFRHLLPLLATACLLGCGPASFQARGKVSSISQQRRDTWSSTPVGCTRDPSDGKPIGQSRTIATLLWVDPGHYNPRLDNRDKAPDAPMQLDLLHSDTISGMPVYAVLHTRYKAGILLDSQSCQVFEASTTEAPPKAPMTRPSLSGTLHFDCQVNQNDLRASVTFQHCEY
jgi:hypothetical protein